MYFTYFPSRSGQLWDSVFSCGKLPALSLAYQCLYVLQLQPALPAVQIYINLSIGTAATPLARITCMVVKIKMCKSEIEKKTDESVKC